jgi:hypothetical protein
MNGIPWISAALLAAGAASCQSAVALPQGDLFAPLMADPKEPQFFMSGRSVTPEGGDSNTIAAVGFGETFGLYRNPGKEEGDGLQVNIAGGLFAQFNLDTPSSDLINADYVIGLPITYRSGANALRLRVYHQSSHLGDEFLLSPGAPPRQNLSYEAIELLGSRDWRPFRFYAGGEYLFHREPEELEPSGLHGGAEYRSKDPVFGTTHLIGGIDVKSWEQHDWQSSASVVFGFEFDSPAMNGRRVRLLFEYYDGFAPYGQFYDEEITYYGFGFSFGF